MRRLLYAFLCAAPFIGCDDPSRELTAPTVDVPQVSAPAFALLDSDNGDGTHTMVLQPGPGLNNGTDEGGSNGGKDAMLFAVNPTSNYGNAFMLGHWNSNCNGFTARSVYRFDVTDLPHAVDVVSAQLQFYVIISMGYGWSYQLSPTLVQLRNVLTPWNEMTATWNAQPGLGAVIATASLNTPTFGRMVPSGSIYQNVVWDNWVTFDVTNTYLQWKAGTLPNHGVEYERPAYVCENANNHSIVTSDVTDASAYWLPMSAGLRPKLVVRYRARPTGQPPVAMPGGPYAGAEGSVVQFDGSRSNDPDGTPLLYAWDFGDGSTGTGVRPTHTYVQNGRYPVTLTVVDGSDAAATARTEAVIENIAPVTNAGADAQIFIDEVFEQFGGFTDPGQDTWTATVDYGDGTGVRGLMLGDRSFLLAHRYASAGQFTVTIRVTDQDGAVGVDLVYVKVLGTADMLQRLIALVKTYRDSGLLKAGEATSLLAKLDNAARQLGVGKSIPVANILGAFENEVGAIIRSGRVAQSSLQSCLDLSIRIRGLLGG